MAGQLVRGACFAPGAFRAHEAACAGLDPDRLVSSLMTGSYGNNIAKMAVYYRHRKSYRERLATLADGRNTKRAVMVFRVAGFHRFIITIPMALANAIRDDDTGHPMGVPSLRLKAKTRKARHIKAAKAKRP